MSALLACRSSLLRGLNVGRRTMSSARDAPTAAAATATLDFLFPGVEAALSSSASTSTAAASSSSSVGRTAAAAVASSSLVLPPANDPLLGFLTSLLQQSGKRTRASARVSSMLLHIHALTRAPALPLVRHAALAAAPAVRLKSHKHGSKNVQMPVALSEKQRVRAGLRAMLKSSEGKPGKTVEERMAREVVAVVRGASGALEQKAILHRVAMVNRGNLSVR